MKKFLAIMASLLMVFSLASCGGVKKVETIEGLDKVKDATVKKTYEDSLKTTNDAAKNMKQADYDKVIKGYTDEVAATLKAEKAVEDAKAPKEDAPEKK